LHVSTESELKADHYKNKQYVKTRLEVKTLASGLDLNSTSPYIAVPITVVIIMIAKLPPHALNSMNWKISQVMLPPVKMKNKATKSIPGRPPPSYLLAAVTSPLLIT